MRRIAVPLLILSGAFFLTLSPLIRWYVFPRLTLLPTAVYIVGSVQADNATYFSVGKLKEVHGATVRATVTVRGDVKASTGNVAVWDSFTAIMDVNGEAISYTRNRIPLDRSTNLPVKCCQAYADTNHSPKLAGLIYKWPYFPGRRSYPFYVQTLDKALPMVYAGSGDLHGVHVHKYVQTVPPVRLGGRTVPGAVLGRQDGKNVAVDEYYGVVRTYWVSTVTGTALNIEEKVTKTFRDVTGADRLTLMHADFTTSDQQVRTNAATTRKDAEKLVTLHTTLPLAALIPGIVLTVLGLYLVPHTRRRREASTPAGEQPVVI